MKEGIFSISDKSIENSFIHVKSGRKCLEITIWQTNFKQIERDKERGDEKEIKLALYRENSNRERDQTYAKC